MLVADHGTPDLAASEAGLLDKAPGKISWRVLENAAGAASGDRLGSLAGLLDLLHLRPDGGGVPVPELKLARGDDAPGE